MQGVDLFDFSLTLSVQEPSWAAETHKCRTFLAFDYDEGELHCILRGEQHKFCVLTRCLQELEWLLLKKRLPNQSYYKNVLRADCLMCVEETQSTCGVLFGVIEGSMQETVTGEH